METTQDTTQPVAGSSPEGGSQGSSSSSQEPVQTQPTGTVQVENSPQPTSSEPTERPLRTSDFVAERQWKREMQSTLQQQQQMIAELVKTISSGGQTAQKPKSFNYEEFIQDPEKYLNERDRNLQEQILNNEFPKLTQQLKAEQEKDRQWQEALNLMFPKTNESPYDDVRLRIKKSQQRMDELDGIWAEYGLDGVPPAKAARIAVEIYDAKHRGQAAPRNPYAPTKAQMAPTSSGIAQGGQKKMDPNQLAAKADQMKQQMGLKPELMFDDNFRNEWNAVKAELVKQSQAGA
jgi:hypothetical protein